MSEHVLVTKNCCSAGFEPTDFDSVAVSVVGFEPTAGFEPAQQQIFTLLW
jgi:hypothetical protein